MITINPKGFTRLRLKFLSKLIKVPFIGSLAAKRVMQIVSKEYGLEIEHEKSI